MQDPNLLGEGEHSVQEINARKNQHLCISDSSLNPCNIDRGQLKNLSPWCVHPTNVSSYLTHIQSYMLFIFRENMHVCNTRV